MFLYLFYFFLAYSLYQLLFKFIIPIYRTTRQVKKSFREMNQHMNGQSNGQQQAQSEPSAKQRAQQPKGNVGEYIDFEEIKD